jgi:hypothetical protein
MQLKIIPALCLVVALSSQEGSAFTGLRAGPPPPRPGRLLRDGEKLCKIVQKAADKIVGTGEISDLAGCTELGAAAAGACELAGLGPEDPLSDVCAGVLGVAGKVACDKMVSSGADFGINSLLAAVGCSE